MNSILIMHQGALGDLILSLPSFYTLRKAYPHARFEIMGYPSLLSLLHHRFYADAITSADRAEVASLYCAVNTPGENIADYIKKFIKVFVFGGESQRTVVNTIASFNRSDVYHIKIFPEINNEHVADYQLRQLSLLGINTERRTPAIYLINDDIKRAEEFLYNQGIDLRRSMLAAIHLGSGSLQKNWPAGNFIALIKTLYENTHTTPVLIEGPADGTLVQHIRQSLKPNGIPVFKHLELPLLAAVLKQCRVFVGNDSGITHLAAALDVNTIAIFGPTDPLVWGPRGKDVSVIRNTGKDENGWKWAGVNEVLARINYTIYPRD